MGVLAVTSKVMSKLTVALLAALICIILADVSGEQQSIETDTLSEVLSDHKLVKREADPERKKKKKKAGKRASKKRRNKKKKCRKGAKGKDCRKARRQAKKGGKSGKGGNAKERRTNKKKCPKGKAGKDCRKAKRSKGKKSRSNGKGGKGGKKGGKKRSKQASRQFTTCFEKMYKYTAKMKKANNIQKQFLRVNGSKGTISSKKDKKGSFNGTLSTLTTALGGNKTNPKCAASSRAFNSTLDTLDRCEADIEASCTFSVNDTRFAEIEQCYKDAKSFYDQVDKCHANGNSNTTAACSCFDALDLDALLAKVKACDVSKDNADVNKEKKKC